MCISGCDGTITVRSSDGTKCEHLTSHRLDTKRATLSDEAMMIVDVSGACCWDVRSGKGERHSLTAQGRHAIPFDVKTIRKMDC